MEEEEGDETTCPTAADSQHKEGMERNAEYIERVRKLLLEEDEDEEEEEGEWVKEEEKGEWVNDPINLPTTLSSSIHTTSPPPSSSTSQLDTAAGSSTQTSHPLPSETLYQLDMFKALPFRLRFSKAARVEAIRRISELILDLSIHDHETNQGGSDDDAPGQDHLLPTPNSDNHAVTSPELHKLNSSKFPIASIVIGRWKICSAYDGHLVGKVYSAKRKLIWELLENSFKRKIEMSLDDICAIKINQEATLLEIELERPPLFFEKTILLLRKNTKWKPIQDFTENNASNKRIHCVSFPKNVFEKHYKNILQSEARLALLSHNPFPLYQSPNFN